MKPVKNSGKGLLVIVDGLGLSKDEDDNPVKFADTPFLDKLNYEKLVAVGPRVGMTEDAMGSTAVGHEVMSGVDYVHPMVRVAKDIKDGVIKNKVIDDIIEKVAARKKALHLMGLVSTNREHSDIRHLYAIMRRAVQKGVEKIYIHFFSDGRGTPPFSGVRFAEDLQMKAEEMASDGTQIKLATVSGRDISMNRSSDSWYKTIKVYRAIIEGIGTREDNIFRAFKKDYEEKITDQYINVRVLGDYKGVSEGDALFHWNFRKDRASMLMKAFLKSEEELKKIVGDKDFKKLKEKDLDYSSLDFGALVEYYKDISCPVAYEDLQQADSLGSMLEKFGYTQYRVSGVDKKQAVVLLSGGSREEPFEHEHRVVVPLPEEMENYMAEYEEKKGEPGFKMNPYEKFPKIELPRLTDKIVEILKKSKPKFFMIVNIANPDMVGHTANKEAAIKAIEKIDDSLKKITEEAEKNNTVVFITADHGNLEDLLTDDDTPSTFHTQNPVPFLIKDQEGKDVKIKKEGCLKDVAPTVLYAMEPEKRKEIKDKLKGEILIDEE
ncbi:MAG: 2,3-bisphosphoglycerate-independent phosphoglycerate mutase [Elusimicrobiota bacterium]